jgi:DHA2 family metal-tetracycline-proton antiporter-like MFS transporter
MNANKLVPWIIYLIFFAVLNETVFNVSTPLIAKQFSLTPAGVSWMMTIFLVFFGIGSVIYGKLSDIYSLRSLIIIGIVIYNVGSIMGFALQFSYPLVIAARALQGIGASAIPALIFVVVARYFADLERGKIFGFITSTVSLAIGLGPVIGGFVAGTFHWSYLFLISLFILIAIPFLRRELPQEPRREGTIDIPGAVLVALTVGALVIFLNFSEWYYLAAFAVMLMLSILRMRTASDPFIKPSLFKNAKFRTGVVVGFCLFSIVIGVLFLIPLMLNDIHALNASQIGLVLFPGAISSVAFGPIAGNLADRKGNSFVVSIGLLLLIASMVLMSFLMGVSALIVAAALLLTYVGFSLSQTAMINSVSQTLPEHETGVGMGLFNLVSIISGALGTALVGKILSGKWLEISLVPAPSMLRGFGYSNLMIVFSIVIALGGLLYLRSFRTVKEVEPVSEEVKGEPLKTP